MTTYDAPGAHGEHIPTSPPGPGMNSLMHYLLSTYPGSTSLGCYNDRSIRKGSSPSVHAVSRAFDWQYGARAQAVDFMDRFTDGTPGPANTVGIQAVHDYHVRNPQGLGHTWGHGRGWHYGNIGPGNLWLHVELTVEAAATADLMKRMGYSGPTHEPAHSAPADDLARAHTDHSAGHPSGHGRHELTLGATGGEVLEMQRLLIAAGAMKDSPGNLDGVFGRGTLKVLKRFQETHGLAVDGRCGQRTWSVLGG